jgi:serine/threonine protein kinase
MLKKAEVIRLQQVEHMVSEKTILAKMDHPFIVRLAGTFQDPKYLYMALEYIVGGVRTYACMWVSPTPGGQVAPLPQPALCVVPCPLPHSIRGRPFAIALPLSLPTT